MSAGLYSEERDVDQNSFKLRFIRPTLKQLLGDDSVMSEIFLLSFRMDADQRSHSVGRAANCCKLCELKFPLGELERKRA